MRRFYEKEGAVFSGEPLDDYEMLMELIYNDLEIVEVGQMNAEKPTVLFERFPYRYVCWYSGKSMENQIAVFKR